uniref:Phage integrase family protein n=1 Tax=Nonomuraea gerenzanensis TaxID=93944 RepID=A0A1M4EMJ9_9ACTN|nr:hypothetical protein [Nonomuraea gerenzanensis]SBP00069.1 phage integrase family protein [Nonomuraea gerenzanensis]
MIRRQGALLTVVLHHDPYELDVRVENEGRQGRYQDVAENLKVKGARIGEADRFVICLNPEGAERDAAIRRRLIAQLEEVIADTDTLSATKRAEMRGVISTKPGLNRYLRTITYRRVWARARADALRPTEVASPLAKRVYDLRHACVSTWLNAGVPATQVAAWAGHSVEVLLRIYAKCVAGQDEAARRRILTALQQD